MNKRNISDTGQSQSVEKRDSTYSLEGEALMFWPENLSKMASDISVIPKLIETQDQFIAVLLLAKKNPFAWKEILPSTDLPANLFLKHLMVLADVGGEKTQRISREFQSISAEVLEFTWNEEIYTYRFQTLGQKPWSNSNLFVDGKGLNSEVALFPMIEDVANFILYAGTSTSEDMPPEFLEKCVIGNLIGHKEELDLFVKQRYIWVSRITGGATSNDLGNIAQRYVADYIAKQLPDWDFSKKSIPNISHNERTNMSFDILGQSPKGKYCAIEASFQVTTNSVIERKAGQAKSRQEILHENGHRIAYVIDGSGNFTRSSALATIMSYSDCTVTYKDRQLDLLVDFLKKFDEE